MSERGLWQCRVCESVNRGGRLCGACGAVIPMRTAVPTVVRARFEDRVTPAHTAMPTPRRRHTAEPLESGWEVRPMPGGCLVDFGPRSRRRTW